MAYYLIQATIIIEGLAFDPLALPFDLEGYASRWVIGEYIQKNTSLKHTTSGVSYQLLENAEDPDWAVTFLNSLRAWLVKWKVVIPIIPTPLLSICIRTGGTDFPPLYFSREVLALIAEINAELDIDVITTAALEKCED